MRNPDGINALSRPRIYSTLVILVKYVYHSPIFAVLHHRETAVKKNATKVGVT
jgi:hypothetical protein